MAFKFLPGNRWWVRVLSDFYYYYPGGAVVASPLYVAVPFQSLLVS